jgi:predicted signal transduction protein with EAL and GGDEF domain
VGDLLLQQAAQRLILTLGESTLVARLGSDEFAVLLAGSAATGDLPTVTRAAQQALSKAYAFESGQRDLTASLGVAVFPWDGDNAATLLQSAEAAMRHAKAQGRNSLQFFTPELRHAVQERKTMDQDLRRALQNNELLLHFQPQVDALTGTMTGAEALVRWMHPTRGMIRPTQFIQIAEENGLIERIGFWVLNEACRVLRDWLDHGLNGITMSVNLSALQLKNKTWAQDVAAVLAQHRLPGNNLELELTESVAMADPTATIDMLQRLRGLDVQLAIDDFGTGYSSLSYLQLLPLQRLKLDRSFVTAMDRNPKDAAICSATIALAHKLGLAVVAEGVETQVQRAYLLRDGCDVLQGYLFSQPVTADAAMAFAQAHA